MKKIYSTVMMLAMMFAALSFSACSKSDDDLPDFKNDYDVLQINGVKYACYGYRSIVTYVSTWDLSHHTGELRLPCGLLSDAEKGEYDYDYMYTIYLEGDGELKKGCKLEDFDPWFEVFGDWNSSGCDYVSGSATVTDKKNDDYVTIKFDSFTFSEGNKSYTLNGTVQLQLDED